ncbi:MAG TPA: BatA domain-containing protein [Gemmatimonadaceae bacterium]|nr:BatA domain-containing protein [Gemmatimonadaceae bacterium]
MSFLAPLWLLLAGAAAVPLLLHLLRRNVSARVEFPAARYLQRAEREHSRSLRLRNLLLMLLRVLLLLALALAAARPFVRGVGRGHGATAVAVVLDNSLSTTAMSDGRPLFEQLRAAARDVLGAATPADRLWLATADGRLQAGTREALLAELARVGPIEGAGDLSLAVARASAAVDAAALPARVVAVVTDGQLSGWNAARRVPDAVTVLVPRGEPPRNRTVAAVEPQPARWTPRGAVVARIASPDSVGYRLVIGERTAARGLAARDEAVTVRLAPAERGWQEGRVELEPDDFPADDARHFAIWIGAPPVVSVDPAAGPFVSTAVSTLVADGRAAQGGGIRIGPADQATTLPALLVAPADPLRLGAANRALARLGVPWRFGASVSAPTLARGARLEQVSITRRYRLVPQGAATSDTLASANGDPWIVAGDGYVLLASPIDPQSTSLPLRAAFLPWLADVLGQRLGAPSGDVGAPVAATPGQSVVLPAGVDALETGSGVRRSVSGGRITAPAERGVWFFLRAGRRVGALVVEAPESESDLTRLSAERLAARLGGSRGRGVTDGDDLGRATFAVGARHPAVTPLLVLALLILVAEALTVRASRSTAA